MSEGNHTLLTEIDFEYSRRRMGGAPRRFSSDAVQQGMPPPPALTAPDAVFRYALMHYLLSGEQKAIVAWPQQTEENSIIADNKNKWIAKGKCAASSNAGASGGRRLTEEDSACTPATRSSAPQRGEAGGKTPGARRRTHHTLRRCGLHSIGVALPLCPLGGKGEEGSSGGGDCVGRRRTACTAGPSPLLHSAVHPHLPLSHLTGVARRMACCEYHIKLLRDDVELWSTTALSSSSSFSALPLPMPLMMRRDLHEHYGATFALAQSVGAGFTGVGLQGRGVAAAGIAGGGGRDAVKQGRGIVGGRGVSPADAGPQLFFCVREPGTVTEAGRRLLARTLSALWPGGVSEAVMNVEIQVETKSARLAALRRLLRLAVPLRRLHLWGCSEDRDTTTFLRATHTRATSIITTNNNNHNRNEEEEEGEVMITRPVPSSAPLAESEILAEYFSRPWLCGACRVVTLTHCDVRSLLCTAVRDRGEEEDRHHHRPAALNHWGEGECPRACCSLRSLLRGSPFLRELLLLSCQIDSAALAVVLCEQQGLRRLVVEFPQDPSNSLDWALLGAAVGAHRTLGRLELQGCALTPDRLSRFVARFREGFQKTAPPWQERGGRGEAGTTARRPALQLRISEEETNNAGGERNWAAAIIEAEGLSASLLLLAR